jgi:hypothetical protein
MTDVKLNKNGLTATQQAQNNRKKQIRLNNARKSRTMQSRGRRPAPRYGRGRGTMRGRGGFRREPTYPPLSYAQNYKSGFQISFQQGRVPGCVRIHTKFRVCQIGVGTIAGLATQCGFINFGASSNTSNIIPLNTSQLWFFPPHMRVFTYLFSYFYINNAKIIVKPRVNVQNNAVCTLAYCGDPIWPEAKGQVEPTSHNANFSELQLSTLPNACTEVLYRDCQVSAYDVDRKRKFFTANEYTAVASDFNYTNLDPSDIRQSVAGLFCISGIRNGTDIAGTVYGDVYMELDIELCEMSAPSSGIVLPQIIVPTRRNVKSLGRRVFNDEFDLDDDEKSEVYSIKSKKSNSNKAN